MHRAYLVALLCALPARNGYHSENALHDLDHATGVLVQGTGRSAHPDMLSRPNDHFYYSWPPRPDAVFRR